MLYIYFFIPEELVSPFWLIRFNVLSFYHVFFPSMPNFTPFSLSWLFILGLEFALKYIKHLVLGFLKISFSLTFHMLISISYFPAGPQDCTQVNVRFSSLWMSSICVQRRSFCWVRLGSLLPQQAWECPLNAGIKEHPWEGGSLTSYTRVGFVTKLPIQRVHHACCLWNEAVKTSYPSILWRNES